jgi:hypothetical protein
MWYVIPYEFFVGHLIIFTYGVAVQAGNVEVESVICRQSVLQGAQPAQPMTSSKTHSGSGLEGDL